MARVVSAAGERMGTVTLTEFLLARIAEDEAAARAAGGEEWYSGEVPGPTMRKSVDEPVAIIIDSPRTLISYEVVSDEVAQHIVAHDPARVLAVCEAHRRIVALHVEDEGVCRVCQWDRDCDQPIYTHNDDPAWLYPCPTLRALAAIYADRDGFREEWR